VTFARYHASGVFPAAGLVRMARSVAGALPPGVRLARSRYTVASFGSAETVRERVRTSAEGVPALNPASWAIS
jgi:hypothetical protein